MPSTHLNLLWTYPLLPESDLWYNEPMHEILCMLKTPLTIYELMGVTNKSQRTMTQQVYYLRDKGWIDVIGNKDKRNLWQINSKGEQEIAKLIAGVPYYDEIPEEKKPAQSPKSDSIMDLNEKDLANITALKLNKFKPTIEEAMEWTTDENMTILYQGLIVRRILRTEGAK